MAPQTVWTLSQLEHRLDLLFHSVSARPVSALFRALSVRAPALISVLSSAAAAVLGSLLEQTNRPVPLEKLTREWNWLEADVRPTL